MVNIDTDANADLFFLDLLLVLLALLLHLRHLVKRERLGLVILRLVVPVLGQRPVFRPLFHVIVTPRLQLEHFPAVKKSACLRQA